MPALVLALDTVWRSSRRGAVTPRKGPEWLKTQPIIIYWFLKNLLKISIFFNKVKIMWKWSEIKCLNYLRKLGRSFKYGRIINESGMKYRLARRKLTTSNEEFQKQQREIIFLHHRKPLTIVFSVLKNS